MQLDNLWLTTGTFKWVFNETQTLAETLKSF